MADIQDQTLVNNNGTVATPETGYHITVTKPSENTPYTDKGNTTLPNQNEVQADAIQEVSNTDYDKVQQALKAGLSKNDIATYMAQSRGISIDEADAQVVNSVQDKVIQAKKSGLSEEDIKQYLIQNKFNSQVIDNAIKGSNLNQSYKKLDYNLNDATQVPIEETATNTADLYRNIYSEYSTLGDQVQGLWDEQSGIKARRAINQLNLGIVNKLKSQGIDAFVNTNSGDAMMREKNGAVHEVDSSILNSLVNSKGEIAGAIAGGVAGARVGAIAGAIVPPLEPIAIAAGGIVGSMYGAAAGRGLDLAYNSSLIKEKIESKLFISQMQQAGIFDGVASVLGSAVFKASSVGLKGVIKGWKYFSAGNTKGAYKALLENMNMTDEQAKAIVANWEQHVGEKNTKTGLEGLTPEQKAIKVISSTQQGAEMAVKHAAGQDPKMTNAILDSINKRAKTIHTTVNSVVDENIGKQVRTDLTAYQKDVKDFYGQVKQQGIQYIEGTDFKFDLNKIAIKPVMDNIAKRISNPKVQEQFVLYATRIENASADRSFGGLIELRQAVNDFKYSKSELNTPDLEALNKVINRIDTQINKAAKDYIPNSKQWMENFSKAKTEYAKMKQLEENALYKLVTRESATETTIQKALSKYGNDKDVDEEVFNKVVERLSPATRAKVEASAIKNLTNKYTYGEMTDLQAIHFPALADTLKALNITTPEAKGLVKVIDDIAKVYKNDAVLSSIVGNTAMPKMAGSLSSNIEQKAHYAIIGKVWSLIARNIPLNAKTGAAAGAILGTGVLPVIGTVGGTVVGAVAGKVFGKEVNKVSANLALVHQVSKLLENPLHYKTAEDLIRMVPKQSQDEMRSLVKELQIQTAKQGKQATKPTINMYKQSKTGELTVTSGALGKGVYLVEKIVNPNTEMKVAKQVINISKMATLDNISSIIGKSITEKDIRTLPNIQQLLSDKGFLGIKLDGKAMLFPETTLKVKAPIKQEVKAPIKQEVKAPIKQEVKAPIKQEIGNQAIKDIVTKMNKKEISGLEGMKQAKELGFNVSKRNYTGAPGSGTWIYNKIPTK